MNKKPKWHIYNIYTCSSSINGLFSSFEERVKTCGCESCIDSIKFDEDFYKKVDEFQAELYGRKTNKLVVAVC